MTEEQAMTEQEAGDWYMNVLKLTSEGLVKLGLCTEAESWDTAAKFLQVLAQRGYSIDEIQ